MAKNYVEKLWTPAILAAHIEERFNVRIVPIDKPIDDDFKAYTFAVSSKGLVDKGLISECCNELWRSICEAWPAGKELIWRRLIKVDENMEDSKITVSVRLWANEDS